MYIRSFSGARFDFLDMAASQVNITDIAHSLSQINRFSGHTKFPYSVALHCLAVSVYLEAAEHPMHIVLGGLLHDAHEAYFSDIPTPVKHYLERDMPADMVAKYGIRAKEKAVQAVVAEKLGVPHEWLTAPEVKMADMVALAVERDVLQPGEVDADWCDLSMVTAEMREMMVAPLADVPPAAVAKAFEQRYLWLVKKVSDA